MLRLLSFVVAALVILGVAANAEDKNKANLDRAKNTVDRIRQPDPPQVSTSTVRSPTAAEIAAQQNAAEKARQKGASDLKTKPPPSPR
jgi:hypothetical protein